ncbi:MAG TPA: hypothetical protein PK771_02345 [Spirochaetota bacterium]|nr:hypothetical protein [Spirochaetota bacterium]
MEIIKSFDKLSEEIINDANTKAERIRKKTEQEIVNIEKEYNVKIENAKSQIAEKFNKEIKAEIDKINASIDIEIKKQKIEFIGKILDEIFDDLAKSIIEEKYFKYSDFILMLIKESLSKMDSTSYIAEINKNQSDKIDKKKLKELKVDKIVEADSLEIRIYSSDKKKMVYISLNDFINKLKEKERNNIYNIITK